MQRVEKIKLNSEVKEFKKIKLLGRYTAKLLYGEMIRSLKKNI